MAALVALPPSTENEWRLIPFTTSLVPFRYTPSCGKNSTVRKPILVSRVWITFPSGDFNSRRATYRLGSSVDQVWMSAHCPSICCSLSESVIFWKVQTFPYLSGWFFRLSNLVPIREVHILLHRHTFHMRLETFHAGRH